MFLVKSHSGTEGEFETREAADAYVVELLTALGIMAWVLTPFDQLVEAEWPIKI